MKKTLKFMLCGATVMLFAACGGAASDGEKAAELQYNYEQAAAKDANSDEAKKAKEELDAFRKEKQDKFAKDTTGQGEFEAAYAKKYAELSKGGEQK